MKSSMSVTVALPDLLKLSQWTFSAKLNPHYEEIESESHAWLESSNKYEELCKYKLPLLASLAYPTISKEHLRLASDLMIWYMVFKDVTDGLDPKSTQRLTQIVSCIIKDPRANVSSRDSYSPLANLTKDVWARIAKFSTLSSLERVRGGFLDFCKAVCIEVEDKSKFRVRGIGQYLELRRTTMSSPAIFYFRSVSVHIPQEIMDHPQIVALTKNGMDLISIQNDIVSYNMERSTGHHCHNLITVVMKEKNLNIQEAFDYCGQMFAHIATDFRINLKTLPKLSVEMDQVLSQYVMGIADWVTGITEWSFITERYFGKDGKIVKERGIIELVPELREKTVEFESLGGEC